MTETHIRLATYDTTLCDALRHQGMGLTVNDSLAIIAALDGLGVDVIDMGYPAQSPADRDLCDRALSDVTLTHSRLGASCTWNPDDERNVAVLMDCDLTVMTLSVPTTVWKGGRDDAVLGTLAQTVASIHAAGRQARVRLEHAFTAAAHGDEAGFQHMLSWLVGAARAGADTVVVSDSEGTLTPATMQAVFPRVMQACQEAGVQTTIGVACFDDCGCAVANTMIATDCGAREIQGSVNGVGERAGSANLLTLIANYELKVGRAILPGDEAERRRRLERLTEVARTVGDVTSQDAPTHMPYVGTRAFTYSALHHDNTVAGKVESYRHVSPQAVGNSMTIRVADSTNYEAVQLKALEFGMDVADNPELIERLAVIIRDREAAGYCYDAADGSLELLMRSTAGELPEYFHIESWRASIMARPMPGETFLPAAGHTVTEAEAMVRLWVGNRRLATLGEGNGPVNAVDYALRNALEQAYPETADMELTDYRVRILDAEGGTHAIVRVLITFMDSQREWRTVGVGTDIIEASWEALTDGLIVGLMRRGVKPQPAV